ncbi:hypothetical protein Tco_0520224 [Tanacetum coccineum]
MAPVESPQMISTIKLPMLKKGEYTLWSMRMEQYPTNTDYGLWQVIMNSDEPVQTTKDKNGVKTEVPPKTAQALLQRQKERKAKSTLLLAIPDEYQLRFHDIKDAKTLWATIKIKWSTIDMKTRALDQDNLEEMDIKWQVAMLSMRVKHFYKKTGRKLIFNGKEHVGFDKAKVECFNCHRRCHFARECKASRNQWNKNGDVGYRSRDNTRRTVPVETSNALVVQDNALIVQDGLGYDWSYIAQDELTEFALMAYTSNSSGFDTKLGLESVEAQLVVHQKKEVVYEEKIAVLEFEVKDKGNAVTRLTNQLEQTLKEKEDLKAKLEQFETSSKNLTKLINSQISSKDQLNENSSDSGLFNSVFDSRSSDADDNQTNDRFKKDNEYHVVPPPLTGNYIPPLAILSFAGLNDSVYRPTAIRGLVLVFVCLILNTRVLKEKVNTVRVNGVNTARQIAVSTVKGNGVTVVKALAGYVWRPKKTDLNNGSKDNSGSWISKRVNYIDPQGRLKSIVAWESQENMSSLFLTKALLTDYQDIDGGFVAFGGKYRGSKVQELKFNLFSISQMCDKKNSILFTETECLVLSPDFKLIDESQVLLRVPRQNNMYSFDLKNVVPSRDLTCLFAKATIDVS